ncbi:multidrug efflux SMR transporter [Geomicrobium sp. JCM 19038]|uniref:DMT family transporter n=1 Tax=Geomicrobium sp. JCM 19038 TaxID=1460635 RepID=UPI0005A9FBBD|nr:multidrug efflux SMR transporter [Geomicrobium sp. JCM 19038]
MSKKSIYLLLGIAISIEIIGTLFMELSEGFTQVIPTIIVFTFYILAVLLSIVILKYMEVGYFNAVWSGLGTVVVVILGIILFNESINALKIISLAFIVAGILLLNLGTDKKRDSI